MTATSTLPDLRSALAADPGAIIESVAIKEDGSLVPSSSVGNSARPAPTSAVAAGTS